MCNQVLQEQIVATIQPHVQFQEIPEVQFVERIQEQIVDTIKMVSQERVQFPGRNLRPRFSTPFSADQNSDQLPDLHQLALVGHLPSSTGSCGRRQ